MISNSDDEAPSVDDANLMIVSPGLAHTTTPKKGKSQRAQVDSDDDDTIEYV